MRRERCPTWYNSDMTDSARKCTRCGLSKPLEDFARSARGMYGRAAICKPCVAARRIRKISQQPPRAARPPQRREPIDPASPKLCTKCRETKPHSMFSLSRRATETCNAVYRSRCKKCQATDALKWFRDNPGRTAANARKHHLRAYGMSERDYTDLLKSQGGGCAICGTSSSDKRKNGKAMRMPVDHDHITGLARGILCNRCNRAIGLLDDNPILLRKAMRYLIAARNGSIENTS